MRTIPGLTAEILNRADTLSSKASDARSKASGPRASIATPKVTSDGVAIVRLYDGIDRDGGFWGISASEFGDVLDGLGDVSRIELRVNSGGGDVWDGLAILNQLRSFDAPVTAVVDGMAASAASFIAVACDELVMMPNSQLMIHDAIGICMGQPADMREFADFLDEASDNIAEIYATKTGSDVSEWRAVMTAGGMRGQWYSPVEAVEAGLADSIGDADKSAAVADALKADLRSADEIRAAEGLAAAEADESATARTRAHKHRARAQRMR